jgi:predicted nucleic acid-binding protein
MAAALLDTNVLVHAAYAGADHHAAAAILVARGLREAGVFCIAPQNLIEFAAVVSSARLVDRPMDSHDLARMGDLLYRSRRLSKIYPRRGTVMRAIGEGAALGVSGPAWYDLFLAVTMRDAGVESIVTENSRDFSRFPFVRSLTINDALKSI